MYRGHENRVSPRVTTLLFSVVVAICAIVLQSCESAPQTGNGEIHRTSVSSSALQSVGYSERIGVLEIEFHNGAVYQYIDVEPSIAAGLMNAKSKGAYFHEHIRDAGYDFERIR